MEVTYTHAGKDSGREAFRVSMPGLTAFLRPSGPEVLVRDLSATGVGLYAGSAFKPGQQLELDLVLSGVRIVTGLTARVVRVSPRDQGPHDRGLVGCVFGEMSRQTSIRLDKLLLEVQKRRIAARKLAERGGGKSAPEPPREG